MPESQILKQLVGTAIDVDRLDGRHAHGMLLNVNRRSLWLVSDDEDVFVPIEDVAQLRPAS
jgi:hypothetical protein